MNEQRDQTSTDIVIVAVALLVVVLVFQLKPVQLMMLKMQASLDSKIAWFCGETAAQEGLSDLAGWIERADRDPHFVVDLDQAEKFHERHEARIMWFKLVVTLVTSIALVSLMIVRLFKDWRKAQMKPQTLSSKMSALENAKALIIKRAPKYASQVAKARDSLELYKVFEGVRNEINIPNNLVARCWPYGSQERRMFLDCQRDLALAEERK